MKIRLLWVRATEPRLYFRERRIDSPEFLPWVAAQIPYRHGKHIHCLHEERVKAAA
ncbi:MAG TPA: hypothetical protein VK689_13230 [Armatimonadota bacterium]|nr:hypothetical protein [Armatimonadota bacterium]